MIWRPYLRKPPWVWGFCLSSVSLFLLVKAREYWELGENNLQKPLLEVLLLPVLGQVSWGLRRLSETFRGGGFPLEPTFLSLLQRICIMKVRPRSWVMCKMKGIRKGDDKWQVRFEWVVKNKEKGRFEAWIFKEISSPPLFSSDKYLPKQTFIFSPWDDAFATCFQGTIASLRLL